MSENNENENEKKEKDEQPQSCEHASERRTAVFLSRRLEKIQDQLFDLMADMRTFEHYSEIEDAGWCLMLMQRLKCKYRKFADEGVWPER